MKSRCKNFKALAVANPHEAPQNLMVAPIRCRMWSCPYCAKKNQSIWRAHIIDRINALGGEWVFITLTAHRRTHYTGKTLINIKRGWKILYDRLRRHFKQEKMEYVLLYEKHKEQGNNGLAAIRYHAHAVLRVKLEGSNSKDKKTGKNIHRAFTQWLKRNSVGVGIGWSCHAAKINEANGGLVAAYITKYMTKSAQDFHDFPKRMRRIQASRGIGSPKPEKSPEKWRLRAGIIRRDVQDHERVFDVSTGEVIDERYFRGYTVYPPEFDPDYEPLDDESEA